MSRGRESPYRRGSPTHKNYKRLLDRLEILGGACKMSGCSAAQLRDLEDREVQQFEQSLDEWSAAQFNRSDSPERKKVARVRKSNLSDLYLG